MASYTSNPSSSASSYGQPSSFQYTSVKTPNPGPPGKSSSGSGKPQIAKSPPPNFRPPHDTAFLFRIDHLTPNWVTLAPQFYPNTLHWKPPFHWNAYTRTDGTLYRWKNGVITNIPQNTAPGDLYACATVFTQSPWTQHFLVVNFNAQQINVSQNGDWQTLGFNHVEAGGNSHYSELDIRDHTSDDHLVAPAVNGVPAWEQELFTSQYRWNPQCDAVGGESAGLIGKLTFLLALVAFSRPPAELHNVLTQHVRPGQWIPLNTPDDGRLKYRGMIVTIYLDPVSNTTAQILRGIEKGQYGAFFR